MAKVKKHKYLKPFDEIDSLMDLIDNQRIGSKEGSGKTLQGLQGRGKQTGKNRNRSNMNR